MIPLGCVGFCSDGFEVGASVSAGWVKPCRFFRAWTSIPEIHEQPWSEFSWRGTSREDISGIWQKAVAQDHGIRCNRSVQQLRDQTRSRIELPGSCAAGVPIHGLD